MQRASGFSRSTYLVHLTTAAGTLSTHNVATGSAHQVIVVLHALLLLLLLLSSMVVPATSVLVVGMILLLIVVALLMLKVTQERDIGLVHEQRKHLIGYQDQPKAQFRLLLNTMHSSDLCITLTTYIFIN